MPAAVMYPRGAFWRRLDPRSAGIAPLNLANSDYSSAVRALNEQVDSSAPAWLRPEQDKSWNENADKPAQAASHDRMKTPRVR